jgi:hypothetical protein
MYTPDEIRDTDPPPAEAVPMTAAIEQAAAMLSPEEIEAHINAMDVPSLAALEAAFAAAWRATKDAPTRARFKGAYDAMKAEIASAQAREVAETQP